MTASQPTIEAISNRTFGLHAGSTAVGEIAYIVHLISAWRSSVRLRPDPSRTYAVAAFCSLEYIACGRRTSYVLRILGSEVRRRCQCLRHRQCACPTNAPPGQVSDVGKRSRSYGAVRLVATRLSNADLAEIR